VATGNWGIPIVVAIWQEDIFENPWLVIPQIAIAILAGRHI
jgi:hypothetical protein